MQTDFVRMAAILIAVAYFAENRKASITARLLTGWRSNADTSKVGGLSREKYSLHNGLG